MSRGGFRRLLNHGRPPVGKKMSVFRNLGESSSAATSFATWFHALHRNQNSATQQSRTKLTSISAALVGATIVSRRGAGARRVHHVGSGVRVGPSSTGVAIVKGVKHGRRL